MDKTVVAASAESPPQPDSRGWRLLRTRNFGLLWWGQLTSQVGEGLNKVALLWFVYTLTGSALKMTIVGLIQTVPPLLFGPMIGVFLDRLPKKTVMIWVDLIRTVLTFLIPFLFAFNLLSLEGLYVLIFFNSIVSTVFGPALVSAVPILVRPTELVTANALIQGTNNIGLLLGPAISGVLIAFMGAQNVLYVNSGTFLISALCIIPMQFNETLKPAVDLGGFTKTVVEDLKVGFRFVFGSHSTVFLLVIISALYNLGASAFVFILPVYAKEYLQVGPVQLGWLWSALGIGMLVVSTWLAWKHQGDIHSRLRLIVRGMTVGGVAVCSLSLLESPLTAAAVVIVVGGATAVMNPVVWALLQEVTPGHLMGRVVTTFSTGSMAAAMAGMTCFGWIADTIGPAESLIGLGLMLLLTAGVGIWFMRQATEVQQAKAAAQAVATQEAVA